MASFKIIWSSRAKKSYIRIVDFILEKWSTKEVKKYNDRTSFTILKIGKNPEMFIASQKKKNIRKGSYPFATS